GLSSLCRVTICHVTVSNNYIHNGQPACCGSPWRGERCSSAARRQCPVRLKHLPSPRGRCFATVSRSLLRPCWKGSTTWYASDNPRATPAIWPDAPGPPCSTPFLREGGEEVIRRRHDFLLPLSASLHFFSTSRASS